MGRKSFSRQHKRLKGFEKVFVAAGESTDVCIPVNMDELRYFSHIVFVGLISDDAVLLKQELDITSS